MVDGVVEFKLLGYLYKSETKQDNDERLAIKRRETMSAGILSRTVKSVNEIGPHLKPQALNAMSRLSRPQEQLLIVRCHGKDATEAAWARLHKICTYSQTRSSVPVASKLMNSIMEK